MDRPSLDSLLRRAQRHEASALTELVDAYHARVFGLMYRLTGSRETAEDLTQETFLRLVRTIADYQHGGKFEGWLFRIAANLARDHARKRKRRGTMATLDAGENQETLEPPAPNQLTPDDQLTAIEKKVLLDRAIETLPEADREIILLRHYSELPFNEIAEILGLPLGTALARSHRALKKLKAELERLGVSDE